MAAPPQRALAWIGRNDPLPDPAQALHEPNGLLAAGADLSGARLLEAYRHGIYPWYAEGRPVLWWSPDPRMVLYLDEFKTSRSLRQTMRRARRDGRWRLSLDACFERTMRECALPHPGRPDTWITPDIVAAYGELHRIGAAHSVEVWEDERLLGGLYGVSIGRMFFGESMFTRVPDASKLALAALVQLLRGNGFRMIDCQQDTRHLASLGARVISRASFLRQLAELVRQPGPDWRAACIELPDA